VLTGIVRWAAGAGGGLHSATVGRVAPRPHPWSAGGVDGPGRPRWGRKRHGCPKVGFAAGLTRGRHGDGASGGTLGGVTLGHSASASASWGRDRRRLWVEGSLGTAAHGHEYRAAAVGARDRNASRKSGPRGQCEHCDVHAQHEIELLLGQGSRRSGLGALLVRLGVAADQEILVVGRNCGDLAAAVHVDELPLIGAPGGGPHQRLDVADGELLVRVGRDPRHRTECRRRRTRPSRPAA
jgi:hypothetical protein